MTPLRQITRQDWIAALRSGDYEQTTSILKGPRGFCCLGVACDLAEVDLDSMSKEELETGDLTDDHRTEKVAEMLNLDLWSCNWLAEQNDSGLSFSKIADILERGEDLEHHHLEDDE